MSRLAQLASAVSLSDEVAVPTEIKETVAPIVERVVNETVGLLSNATEEPLLPEPVPQPYLPPEPIDDYDAEKEAESLVWTLNAIDGSVLNVVALLKCRSNAGGSKGIEKMKEALAKKATGVELTPEDTAQIAAMAEFRKNMDYLSGKMHVKPDEQARLVQVATAYCEETRFHMGSATAFWANYFGSLTGRITEIIIS